VKVVVAAVQMCSQLTQRAVNVEVADEFLRECHDSGVQLAVLPEMFNTGYGLLPDFGPCSEGTDGPTLRHLSARSRQWGMGIAAGFVECDGRHLYDALALCLPTGSIHVYRKRHLVFWESFRFRAGRQQLVVVTPWGRVGLAVCADMMDRRVWADYRGQIDIAVVASAWPNFACRHSGRRHSLFGHVGPMATAIPAEVARDLDVPVIFANQTGTTRTTIPIIGLTFAMNIADTFAGHSSVCGGRSVSPVIAGAGPQIVVAEVNVPNPHKLAA
jgi:predicted amidohydrolase